MSHTMSRSVTPMAPDGLFIPQLGKWSALHLGDGESIHVVPALGHPDHYHLSNFNIAADVGFSKSGHIEVSGLGGWKFRGTHAPVHQMDVDMVLRAMFGIDNPANVTWVWQSHDGLHEPFGAVDPMPHIKSLKRWSA